MVVHPPEGGGGGGGAVPPPEYDPAGPPPDENDLTSVLPIPLNWRALNVPSHDLPSVLELTRS